MSAVNCRKRHAWRREIVAARIGDDELGAPLRRRSSSTSRPPDGSTWDWRRSRRSPRPRPRRSPGWTPPRNPRPPAAPPRTRRGKAACSDRRCWCRSRCARASGRGRPPRWSPWRCRSPPAHCGPSRSRTFLKPSPANASASSHVASRNTSLQRVGIHREVRRLGDAGLADERLGEALRMLHVVEAEAPLHAQALVVRRAVAALDVDDRVVLHVIGELAARRRSTGRPSRPSCRRRPCTRASRERARPWDTPARTRRMRRTWIRPWDRRSRRRSSNRGRGMA